MNTELIEKDYLKWLEIAERGCLAPWLINIETYLNSNQYKKLIKELK